MSAPLRCTTCGYSTAGVRPGHARMAIKKHSCELKLARDARYARRRRKMQTPGSVKPCLHKIADHQHGTHARYVLDRCRCLPCKYATREYENTRAKLHAYGRFNTLVDAEPVRQHVLRLRAAGIGLKQITRLGGPSGGVMNKLMYGHPNADGTRRPPARRVKPETAQRILAIQITSEAVAAGQCVPSIGTHRRLQALVAVGWSQSKLADLLGMERSNFGRVMQGDTIHLSTHRATVELYERLWNTTPPRENHRDKIAYSRSLSHAKAHHWLPPLAWDDDEIDDPATTAVIEIPPVTIDELAVEHAVSGHRMTLSKAERDEATRRLTALGYSTKRIGERLGVTSRTVERGRAALTPLPLPQGADN